jgi:hypothetical protein
MVGRVGVMPERLNLSIGNRSGKTACSGPDSTAVVSGMHIPPAISGVAFNKANMMPPDDDNAGPGPAGAPADKAPIGGEIEGGAASQAAAQVPSTPAPRSVVGIRRDAHAQLMAEAITLHELAFDPQMVVNAQTTIVEAMRMVNMRAPDLCLRGSVLNCECENCKKKGYEKLAHSASSIALTPRV